jgi:hypothetical protein
MEVNAAFSCVVLALVRALKPDITGSTGAVYSALIHMPTVIQWTVEGTVPLGIWVAGKQKAV